MDMQHAPQPGDDLVISYLTLRRTLGVLGISLPFVLAVGAMIIFGTGLQQSISDYYHTGMRDVFVGIIIAIGLFLAAYKGHKNTGKPGDPAISDNAAANLASICAVGLALFPTTPDIAASSLDKTIGAIHLAFSAIFFLILAYYAYFLFTRTDPEHKPTANKLVRNQIYRVCGVIMVAAIVLIVAAKVGLPDTTEARLKPVFWLESAAIVAFGVSWLIKGETLLRDRS